MTTSLKASLFTNSLPIWSRDSKKYPEYTVWGTVRHNVLSKVLIWISGTFLMSAYGRGHGSEVQRAQRGKCWGSLYDTAG